MARDMHSNPTYQVGTDTLPARQERAREELGHYLSRRDRACVLKVKHSEQSATREARRLQAKGEDRARAYACPNADCRLKDGRRAWHVGRTKRTEERDRAQ